MSEKKDYDKAAKIIFGENHIFADVFNYIIYGGENIIKADDLSSLPTESIQMKEGKIDARYRDLLKCVMIKEDQKNYYVLFGIEHQSKDDFYMIERVMNYNARYLLSQAEKAKKGELLKPILTLVIYTGERKWTSPRTLYETLDIPKDLLPYLMMYEPDRELLLLDLRHMEDNEIEKLRKPLSLIVYLMKYQENKAKMSKVINENEAALGTLNGPCLEALGVFTNSNINDYINDEGEAINMRSLTDTIKEIGIDEGLAKGRLEGRAEGRNEGSSEAYYQAVKGAMKNFDISAEKAMDALNIPLSNREAILKKLEC